MDGVYLEFSSFKSKNIFPLFCRIRAGWRCIESFGSRWPHVLRIHVLRKARVSMANGWYLGCWSKRFSGNGVNVVFWKPCLRGTIWNRDDIDVKSWPDVLEPKLGLEWRHLATHLHQLCTLRRFSCQFTFGLCWITPLCKFMFFFLFEPLSICTWSSPNMMHHIYPYILFPQSKASN